MPQPQDNARLILLIIMILWLNAGNDAGAGLLSAPSLVTSRIHRQRGSWDMMKSSHWGDFAPRQQPAENKADAAPGRYLNLTGFRADDGLAWDDLDRFRRRCLEWSRSAYPFVQGKSLWDSGQTMLTWQNATGSVHGPWVRRPASVYRDAASYNLSTIAALSIGDDALGDVGYGSNIHHNASGKDADGQGDDTEHHEEHHNERLLRPTVLPLHMVDWGRNVTGPSGKLLVRLIDDEDAELYQDQSTLGQAPTGGLVRAASATITIEDVEGTGSSYDLRLHGVHWPHQGTLLLTTTSDKFAGIFALPHLAPNADFFQSSKQLLSRTLDESLRKRETMRAFGPPDPAYSTPLWSSNVDGAPEGFNPTPRCEYIMYVQVHPLDASQFVSPSKHRQIRPGAQAQLSDNTAVAVSERDDVYDNSSALLAGRGSPDTPSNLPQAYDYSQEDMTQIMLAIEHEMRFPSGAPIFGRKGVPDMQMSAVLYSPDCAYFIETKGPPNFAPAEGRHLHGMKSEQFVYEARIWMLLFSAVLFGQVRLCLSQVRETYTPSTLGRISFLTISLMVLADGLTFSAASAWTMTASASFLPSLMVTFAAFTSMMIGGSFLSEIYAAQEPERRRRERQQLQQMRQLDETIRQHEASVRERLQQHYAAARPATPPIVIPSDQDIDAEIAENTRAAATPLLPAPVTAAGAAPAAPAAPAATGTTTNNAATLTLPPQPFSNIAGRMVMIGVVFMFLSLAASTWWASMRAIYANLVAFLYLSMWVPQILRNIERNSRRAFSLRFVIGQSVLRLLPIAYFYLRADNVLFAEPDFRAFACLAGWLWIQMWVLGAQHELGPRFGIPSGWVPEAWEYHPTLREDNVEAGGMPIGLVSTVPPVDPDLPTSNTATTGGPKRRLSNSGMAGGASSGPSATAGTGAGAVANTNIWTMDCAICCETLDVPVVRAGVDDPTAGGMAGVLARRQYMVTPCRHIFHTECLEGWLRFRLQCPICREELPPL